MMNAGINQSKAIWITVGNNINKNKIVNCSKRCWCWAYAGEKMLECLGVRGKQAGHVALTAGHGLGSDNTEDMSVTAWAIKKLLPNSHPLKNAEVYNLCRKTLSGFDGFFAGCSGILSKIVKIIDTNTEKSTLPNGQYARVEGIGCDFNFSELEFLKHCLSRNEPVLARIEESGQSRIVLITGVDYKKVKDLETYSEWLELLSYKNMNIYLRSQIDDISESYVIDRVRYWSDDRGEVEESYEKVFSKKARSYSALL